MSEYLLIESRDPFESNDVAYYYDLARGLTEAGNKVTLFLVQNAVLATRPSAQAPKLRALLNSGIDILADDFVIPQRLQHCYSEQVIRLPCFQANDDLFAIEPAPKLVTMARRAPRLALCSVRPPP